MRYLSVFLATTAGVSALATPRAPSNIEQLIARQKASTYGADRLAGRALENLVEYANREGTIHKRQAECTPETADVRKEWSELTDAEKKEYIAAVQCISTAPSIGTDVFSGARTRYDDFVGTHIAQSLTIHGTANFLSWHRYYTWLYEQALKNECGYTGAQPYWNWGMWAEDPLNSPIFDGSDTSMSGDGAYREHPSLNMAGKMYNPANGGDCITEGPFVNFTVNLGPGQKLYDFVADNPGADHLGYNPRCIIRDINKEVSMDSTQDHHTTDLIENYNDIVSFQDRMQAVQPGFFGVHGGGHYTHGGDPGGDFYTSPGDPVFYLHHAMIDRVWTTWQNLDPDQRTYAVGGSVGAMFGGFDQQQQEGTLDDPLDLMVVGDTITIRDASSTLGGSFCYIYT
ncbi:hypothetical protein BDY21DRAFT_372411 [Lineolata rhizophorae]|uniref:Tyrosinase copper-binding domain-containing protein n=1 Tax=Lineolata rhizophorae TaxID=578093 RepID=A0A6A6NZ05_9PEZI|nr:hypothetical protein BDY21DRAFT_372411 [Lineolata rhizophorae]